MDCLLDRGILSKDTHGTVVRIAPPLNVAREDLVWAVGEIRDVLQTSNVNQIAKELLIICLNFKE